MSFQALKQYRQHPQILGLSNNVNKQKALERSNRPNASISSSSYVHQPSLYVQTDNSKTQNLPRSKKITPRSSIAQPPFSMDNTVGILGGFSVLSTLIFLEKLVQWSSTDAEKEESIPFLVCSDPSLKTVIMSSRASCSSDSFTDRESVRDHLIIENLRKKRMFLEESGAKCLVIPCHLSHTWFSEISSGCSIPFFHAGACVAKELREAKLKPVEAGSNLRIGILATDEVIKAGFYQEMLQNKGFEVVLPDKQTMENIVIPAINAFERKDMEGAQNLLRVAIQILIVKAVNVVILASDELQALLPHDDPLLKQCLDPMDALARAIVKWSKSSKAYNNSSIYQVLEG